MTDWIAAIREHDPEAVPLLDRQEMAWVAALDGDGIRELTRVAQGGCSSVQVSLPPVLAVPIGAGVDRFTLIHNHPGGNMRVSAPDKELTRHVLEAATLCGLTLDDHIIIGRAGTVSLVRLGVLQAADPMVGLAAE